MTPVTRDQFHIRSDCEVVHTPTGATFSTYPYANPDHVLSSVKASWRPTGDQSATGKTFAEQDIGRVACELLLEQARRQRLPEPA